MPKQRASMQEKTRQRKITPRCSIIWAVNKEPGLLFSSSCVHSLSIHASIDDFPSGFRLNFYSIPIPAETTDLSKFAENILIIAFKKGPHIPRYISYFFIILPYIQQLTLSFFVVYISYFLLLFHFLSFAKLLFPYTFTSISFALLLYLREWVSFILTRSTASSFSCRKTHLIVIYYKESIHIMIYHWGYL